MQAAAPFDPPARADAAAAAAAAAADMRRAHWLQVRRWTGCLLLVWALVSFGITWHARALNFSFFGWPFSFWVAAQGAMLVYLALVVIYAWAMHRLDEEHGLDEED